MVLEIILKVIVKFETFDYDYDWISLKFSKRLLIRLRLNRGNRLRNRQSNREDYTSLKENINFL